MKYFIGHLSFRLLCLALTIACFSLPVFSQKSEKAVQDTIKNKTSNEKYLQTSAVSTIRYSDLDKASASNLENALTGKASGLTILRKTGDEPGNSLSDIYIRGIGTYGQFRSPLFLVDDVERDISQMDIEEIESISIFKDGAANTRYGQRGANGTVFVTTKRGIIGKPEISLTAQYGFHQPTRLPDFLPSREYVSLYNKALQNDGLPVPSDEKYNPGIYDGTQNPYLFPDVDWYSSFLKNSTPQQQYKVSVRGGTEQVKYFVLFSFLGKDGLYKYTDINSGFNTNVNYNRYNIRSNIDAAVTKSLDVSLDLAGRIEDKNMPNSTSSDIFNVLSTIAPNAMPITYEDGKIAGTSQYRQNPYGMISHTGYRKDRNKVLQVKAQAKQKLDIVTKGLGVRAMVAFDGVSGYGTGKTSNYATYELQRDNTYSVYGEDKQLSLAQEKLYDYYQYQLAFNAGFSYDRIFGKHEVYADARYYQSQLFVQGDNPAYARQGVDGKLTYCFDKRYVGEISFAYDGSDEYAVCYVTVTGKAKVTGITLDRTSAEVKRGEILTLNVTVSPSYASNKKVVWKSANTKIATVDANGSVTAKAPGRTKITVTSAENSSYQESCTVTVPYKITYKLNKGKNNASNPSTYYGKKVTLKNPSRKGYAFAGWYTDAKFKKKITSISNSAKSDYILYAKWTKVKVAKASLTSAKNSKSKQILLKYKKVSGAKGYEISYSTDKKFKKAVTKKNTAKTSYTISKLKKGKIYYVRIRAYKMDSTGKKVYGKYSSMKKVKVSK